MEKTAEKISETPQRNQLNYIKTYIIRRKPQAFEDYKRLEGETADTLFKKALEIHNLVSRQDPSVVYHLNQRSQEYQDLLKEIIKTNQICSFSQLITLLTNQIDLLGSQDSPPKFIRKFKHNQIIDIAAGEDNIEVDPDLKNLSDQKFSDLQNTLISQILDKKDCTLLYHGTYPDRQKLFESTGLSTNMVRSIMKSIFDQKPKNCYVVLSSLYSYNEKIYDLSRPKHLKNLKKYRVRERRRAVGRGSDIYVENLPEKFLSSFETFLKASESVKRHLKFNHLYTGLNLRAIFAVHEFKFYYYNEDQPDSKPQKMIQICIILVFYYVLNSKKMRDFDSKKFNDFLSFVSIFRCQIQLLQNLPRSWLGKD